MLIVWCRVGTGCARCHVLMCRGNVTKCQCKGYVDVSVSVSVGVHVSTIVCVSVGASVIVNAVQVSA